MLCYHGTTDKKTYDLIMKEGVREYSYWTPFLHAAIQMGGPYVIAAFFPGINYEWIGTSEAKWQFFVSHKIKPKDFIATMKYDVELLTYSREADRKMSKFYRKQDGKKWCKFCDGHGELTFLDDGHWFLIGGNRFDNKVYKGPTRTGPIQLCPKCSGVKDGDNEEADS